MSEVKIVEFDDARHHEGFKAINRQWISTLFVIEPLDEYELDHPVENVINKGGHIFVAELDGQVVGSLGLMRSRNPQYDFEVVKFAVSPVVQGRGIGNRLMEQCLQRAREVGAHRLFLEGNTRCVSANHLYKKYGFHEVPITHAEFARCDVQMVLEL